ncbi:TVP38/TMEM64 family protein [Alkalilacustris brevis]|uniref:TVP38/TMEM64 family protein n=1 Tax=Alkalilacustris brevis TaxID=2026338 RepID=UPI000E0D26BB|nr:VTT domain-containing protein [Alkalilacustris brevis]
MSESMTGFRAGVLRRLPLAIIIVVAIFGALFLRDQVGFEALAAHREALAAFRDAHYAWAALAFVAAYVAVVAFSLPGGTVASLTGGFLFGLFPGVLFNVTGATLGAVALFLAVRAGFGDQLAARIDASKGRARRLKAALEENAFSTLLTVRLIPAVPFFVANLLPALVGMRLAPYAAATFLGIIPAGLVYTWVGAGLGEVIERGETPDLGIMFEWPILGPLLGLAALAALPLVVRALRRRPPLD